MRAGRKKDLGTPPSGKLMWWRFRRQRMAMVGTAVVLVFYAAVVFADFRGLSDPSASEEQAPCSTAAIPSSSRIGRFSPDVYGLTGKRGTRPMTFKRVTRPDPRRRFRRFLAQGFEYRFSGSSRPTEPDRLRGRAAELPSSG